MSIKEIIVTIPRKNSGSTSAVFTDSPAFFIFSPEVHKDTFSESVRRILPIGDDRYHLFRERPFFILSVYLVLIPIELFLCLLKKHLSAPPFSGRRKCRPQPSDIAVLFCYGICPASVCPHIHGCLNRFDTTVQTKLFSAFCGTDLRLDHIHSRRFGRFSSDSCQSAAVFTSGTFPP